MTRSVDLNAGLLYVVTDLHGDWPAYSRYRDDFLEKFHTDQADRLIFLGDLIHHYGSPDEDYSIEILHDIMRLRDELGEGVVIALLGNHELPHIYGITLSKGDKMFTPQFEHALGDDREPIMAFIRQMPFLVRTQGGVMLTHAGASAVNASEKAARFMMTYDHSDLLGVADHLIETTDVTELVARTFGMDQPTYAALVSDYLAVESRDDPRYTDLVRGLIVSNLEEWQNLWEFFFTQCEVGMGKSAYKRILQAFLMAFSQGFANQRALVTGHINVRDGAAVIADHQLRLASWAHAQPRRAAKYLLFDAAQPVDSAHDLTENLRNMP
jgi:hypothetical protein